MCENKTITYLPRFFYALKRVRNRFDFTEALIYIHIIHISLQACLFKTIHFFLLFIDIL